MREKFYTELAEILEVDEVPPNAILHDFDNWDSLTALSIMAMLDQGYSINISTTDLNSIATVEELYNLVNNRMK
jgi:acyl carrier protein